MHDLAVHSRTAAKVTKASLVAGLLLATVAACDDSMGPEGRTLALSFTGLEALSNGFHYEGWAITAAGPVSTGKFNVGSGGGLVTVNGAAIAGGAFATGIDLDAATHIVITIEPSGDVDAVPATTKILAGPLSSRSASLAISASQALATSFSTATGKFILANADRRDEQQRDERYLVCLARDRVADSRAGAADASGRLEIRRMGGNRG